MDCTKEKLTELKDPYADLHPGRKQRIELKGRHRGCGQCIAGKKCGYTIHILDAKDDTEIGVRCVVFLVPPQRAEEWLYTSSEGQWQVVGDTKAGRLILVAINGMDHDNDVDNMKDDVRKLVTPYLPFDCRINGEINYLTQDNSIKARYTLALVESTATGQMLVEDVAVETRKPGSRKGSAKDSLKYFRRLTFRRNPNMIQSEALLVRPGVAYKSKSKSKGKGEGRRSQGLSKKGILKKTSQPEIFRGLKVDHGHLTSDYHEGMIAALALNVDNLKQWLAGDEVIKLMLVGLGAGLLPMFLRKFFPMIDIEVVELDEEVAVIAKGEFGFVEDEKMKLYIEDGVVAVQAVAASASELNRGSSLKDGRLHVLMIDTDSHDPSDGMSCPAPEFLEDAFLLAARQAVRDGGMLIMNVVARSEKFHLRSRTQLKRFFAGVYEIEVDKGTCQVLIATVQPSLCNELPSLTQNLAKLKTTCSSLASWVASPNLNMMITGLKRVD